MKRRVLAGCVACILTVSTISSNTYAKEIDGIVDTEQETEFIEESVEEQSIEQGASLSDDEKESEKESIVNVETLEEEKSVIDVEIESEIFQETYSEKESELLETLEETTQSDRDIEKTPTVESVRKRMLQSANETYGSFVYTVSGTDVIITDYTGTNASVFIPESIDGYTVTEIGDNAFQDCTSIIRVTIPETVTSIGAYAFSGCTALKELTLPESVTYLGEYFIAGTAISTITIPKNVNRSYLCQRRLYQLYYEGSDTGGRDSHRILCFL